MELGEKFSGFSRSELLWVCEWGQPCRPVICLMILILSPFGIINSLYVLFREKKKNCCIVFLLNIRIFEC